MIVFVVVFQNKGNIFEESIGISRGIDETGTFSYIVVICYLPCDILEIKWKVLLHSINWELMNTAKKLKAEYFTY